MRDILFRGKRKDNGEWVEGSLVIWGDKTTSIFNHALDVPTVAVDPSTVGQYTGLTDKNGKRIFEGDVFHYDSCDVKGNAVVAFGEYSFGAHRDKNNVGFYADWIGPSLYYRQDLCFWVYIRGIDFVGNIHDNPELLEGGGGHA